MSVINLTPEERKKFVEYLRFDGTADAEMAKQMLSVPGMELVAERFKTRAAAKMMVAHELDSIEDQTIG